MPAKQICFGQPCTALEGCRCRIYKDRPKHCRQFECGVLKSLEQGRITRHAAMHLIWQARAHCERMIDLLEQLGDTDHHLPLRARTRRTGRRLERIGLERKSAAVYSELTLVAHDLNFLLSEAFYPGQGVEEHLQLEGLS